MRLLIDIDVILDVVLERDPWVVESAQLLAAVEEGRAWGCVTGHTIPTVHYLTNLSRDRRAAADAVTDLLRIVDVVPVEKEDFRSALTMQLGDFEDAVQAVCATKAAADVLVTRNTKDYRGTSMAVALPGAVLAML